MSPRLRTTRTRTREAGVGRARVPPRRLLRGRGRGALELLLLDLGRGRRGSRRDRSTSAVVILGSGPNRIGQGIEFDYCCVHAAQSFRALGYEAVMVNCNPETVSTDYDTSDRLYFEPLGVEEVLAICEREQPDGRGDPVRRPDAAEARAGDRGRRASGSSGRRSRRSTWPRTASASRALLRRARDRGARRGGSPTAADEAVEVAERVGYPVLVRPSYVLGGRAMRVCYDAEAVREASTRTGGHAAGRPLPRERDRDRRRRALRRERDVRRRGHAARRGGGRPLGRLELRAPGAVARPLASAARGRRTRCAGSRPRSAWSACSTSSSRVAEGEVYVLEANPRASRTVPFASKATGVNLVAGRLPSGRRREARRARAADRAAAGAGLA